MEKEIYTFNSDPLTHQPSGFCDLVKISNPPNVLVTYTNMDTDKLERHTIQRIDIDDDKGSSKSVYILPKPNV